MAIPNIIVASAGTTAVNGTYVSNSAQNDRPVYRLYDALYYIMWDDPDWYIYYYDTGFTYLYVSTDDVATPDLCTTWTVVDGDAPVPTVTEESAGGGGGFPILNGSIVR
jgi:hypothetical protein